MMHLSRLFVIALFFCTPLSTNAQEVGPESAVDRFLVALDALDLNGVMAVLTEDATMFFPNPGSKFRADGWAEIREHMAVAFEGGRRTAARRGIDGPPYLGVVADASDRDVVMLGEDAALITWVLDRTGNYGRRTAVVVKQSDGSWKVKHWHSSNMN